MRPHTLALLTALVAATLAPARAAACHVRYVDLFAQADTATRVILGRAVSSRTLTVTHALRGPVTSRVTIPTRWAPCEVSFHVGQVAVVFLDGAGNYLAMYHSAVDVGPHAREIWRSTGEEIVGALDRWIAATTPRDRARVLVDLATTAHGRVAGDAALRLANDATLLGEVTPTDRVALRAALATTSEDALGAVALVLGRLHDAASLGPMVDQLGRSNYAANAVDAALQALTGAHPRVSGVRRPATLEAAWRSWCAGNAPECARE